MSRGESRSNSYFGWARWDILARVPPTAKRILSLGAGEGATEQLLLERGATLLCIEPDPAAASIARARGLEVIEGDASDSMSHLLGRSFDCIIYADVLEHLADPLATLTQHLELLSDGGLLVVSVPNFRHYSILFHLAVRGRVRYVDAGILDRTHIQITTRRMVEEWFHWLPLTLQSCDYIIPGRRDRAICKVSAGLLREFLAKQVVLVARKDATSHSQLPG